MFDFLQISLVVTRANMQGYMIYFTSLNNLSIDISECLTWWYDALVVPYARVNGVTPWCTGIVWIPALVVVPNAHVVPFVWGPMIVIMWHL